MFGFLPTHRCSFVSHCRDLSRNKLSALPDGLFQHLDWLRDLYVCVCLGLR